jgi:hypothetical protein
VKRQAAAALSMMLQSAVVVFCVKTRGRDKNQGEGARNIDSTQHAAVARKRSLPGMQYQQSIIAAALQLPAHSILELMP